MHPIEAVRPYTIAYYVKEVAMSERVVLDRIEGDRAVLLAGAEGRETVTMPLRLLPSGTKEGAAFEFSLLPVSNESNRKEIAGALDALFGETAS